MDADRFDTLLRALVAATSRRDLTRALGALLLGDALRLAAPPAARAKQCGPCRKKKRGKCKKKRPDGTPCGQGKTCLGGQCRPAFQGTCTPRRNICAPASFNCSPNPVTSECNCLVRLTGSSYCAGQFFCSACSSDAQCEEQTQTAGAACVQGNNQAGLPCNCPATGGTMCAEPCPGVA